MSANTIDPLWILIGCGVLAFIYFQQRKRDENGLLPDKAVTPSKVIEITKNFSVDTKNIKGKNIIEADVQRQLLEFYRNEFYHVQPQKPIGGVHAKQIDFDIGDGRVGIEIKMAKSLFKKAEFDRFPAQVKGYAENYEEGNVILLIFASSEEIKDRVKITAVNRSLEDYNVRIEFIEFSGS